jgi:ParB family chromosome partitioning protein
MSNAGLKSISTGHSDIYKIDPRALNVKPNWNERDYNDVENQEYIEKLALSIAKIGVKEPLTVIWEKDKAWLTDGECRLRATLLAISRGAEIKTVPVKAEDRYGNDADRLFSQLIRNAGKPFTPLEQAKVFKRLLDLGWEANDIAEKTGSSIGHIYQVLSLLNLPEVVRQMVTAGEVSATLAQKTMNESNTSNDAVQALKQGIAAAKKSGKKKATAKHLNGNSDFPIVEGVPFTEDEDELQAQAEEHEKIKHRHSGVAKTVFEAFEYSTVDDDAVNKKGEPVVVITMPASHWELIREALKL